MRFHMKNIAVTTFTHIIKSPPHPTEVTVLQHSKMPQSHHLSSLCCTAFPMIPPHTMCQYVFS